MMKTKSYSLALLAALTLAATGTAIADENNAPSMEIPLQHPGGDITIDKVVSNVDGFVVAHEADDEGNPIAPKSIGHTQIKKGSQERVGIVLDRDLDSGEKIFVMLHEDTGEIGKYEFGPDNTDVDKPVMVDGKPFMKSFQVSWTGDH
ncbi:hypothetical protein FGL86_17055 [Pistricoccus aurantiacus]|uniref:DUF7282 domain-containing protein n=1 Tax=Pistricoccus aurantiacus TaxID=1883414 RepID=A0A5B8T0P0_9GAMM|nr:hypothetical protein [Pistricoccus aurantiacus]QEA40618.1 hypothetical protein FGL86_17055 [Pistricoccus aurantiacus]